MALIWAAFFCHQEYLQHLLLNDNVREAIYSTRRATPTTAPRVLQLRPGSNPILRQLEPPRGPPDPLPSSSIPAKSISPPVQTTPLPSTSTHVEFPHQKIAVARPPLPPAPTTRKSTSAVSKSKGTLQSHLPKGDAVATPDKPSLPTPKAPLVMPLRAARELEDRIAENGPWTLLLSGRAIRDLRGLDFKTFKTVQKMLIDLSRELRPTAVA